MQGRTGLGAGERVLRPWLGRDCRGRDGFPDFGAAVPVAGLLEAVLEKQKR